MILAADVLNLHGQLLIGTGRQLTARHLEVLKAWGVAAVAVDAREELPAQAQPSPNAARISAASEIMRMLFCRQDLTNPVVLELFEVCATRKARRVSWSRAA